MKVKEGEADHGIGEKAEEVEPEHAEEAREEVQGNTAESSIPTAQDVDQFLDNLKSLESTAQVREPNHWESEEFLALLEDAEFRVALDAACGREFNSFHVSETYTLEDLKYDVRDRFGKWLPRYRHDASFETMLGLIARSQLIDVHRDPNERCCRLEDLELEGVNVEALRSRDGAAEIYKDIQVHEWLERLTPEEGKIFTEHFIEGKSKSDIARERGVSRQAVAKRLERIARKLEPYV